MKHLITTLWLGSLVLCSCTTRSVVRESGHLGRSVARYAAVGAIMGGGRALIRNHERAVDEGLAARLEDHKITSTSGDNKTKEFTLDDGDVLTVKGDAEDIPTDETITHVRRTNTKLSLSFSDHRSHIELDMVSPNTILKDSNGHTVYSK